MLAMFTTYFRPEVFNTILQTTQSADFVIVLDLDAGVLARNVRESKDHSAFVCFGALARQAETSSDYSDAASLLQKGRTRTNQDYDDYLDQS